MWIAKQYSGFKRYGMNARELTEWATTRNCSGHRRCGCIGVGARERGGPGVSKPVDPHSNDGVAGTGVVQERRPANRFPNKGVGRRDKMMAVSVSLGDGALRIVVTMEGTRSGPAAAVQ